MQYLILGMHRSGTSMLAGLLQSMGCRVRVTENFKVPVASNPNGFWEHQDVCLLNEWLLSSMDGSWYDVARLDTDSICKSIRDQFESRARALIETFDRNEHWAIKDPRLCVLLPAWLRVLERPALIHIYRDPLQVARSLQTRDEFPLHFGLALWEHYVVSALNHGSGLPGVRVSYTEVLQQPVETAHRLADELSSISGADFQAPASLEVHKLVRPELSRSDSAGYDPSQYLSTTQRRLFEMLESGRHEPFDVSEASVELLNSFAAVYRELEGLRQCSQKWAVANHHFRHLEHILDFLFHSRVYKWVDATAGAVNRLARSGRPSALREARRVTAEIQAALDP